MIETVNGSSTPNVIGGRLLAGSGRFSQWSRWPWNAYVTAKRDRERDQADDQARAELAEMLDERRLLAVAQAPRKQAHRVSCEGGGESSAGGPRQLAACRRPCR